MKPFFGYYGSKWMGARRYGPPRRDLVIEPFAGSACYSLWWEAPRVRLYDRSADMVMLWDFLIHCSEADVRAIPAPVRSLEQWAALPDGPRQLVFFCATYASPRMGKRIPDYYFEYVNTGKRIGALKGNEAWNMWDENRQARVLAQKPLISSWTVEQADYRDIPLVDAHWHVDPPYQGPPGRAYPHHDIDYGHLAEWCRALPGAVDVCEQQGADWMEFQPLYAVKSMRAKNRSREVVWRNEAVDLLDIAREAAA